MNHTFLFRIFPVNTFELKSDARIPDTKDELLRLVKSGDLVPFGDQAQEAHGDKDTVDPDLTDWWEGSAEGTKLHCPRTDFYVKKYLSLDLEVQRVLKRYGKYENWEPLFIGTTMDPWYDYRMTWEGRKDKKIQVNGTILSFFLALQVSILEAFRTLSHGLRISRSQQRLPCQTAENQVPRR